MLRSINDLVKRAATVEEIKRLRAELFVHFQGGWKDIN